MTRFIDVEKIHKFVEDNFKGDVPYEWAWTLTAIDKAPTEDVVPVVRCEKCEYGNEHTDCHGRKYYGCDINIDIGEVREVEPTHYCSYGERRTD